MAPPDQARILALDMEPPRLEAPAGSVLSATEPDVEEDQRLPHAALPPTPVLALLRARWPWLAAATATGILVGALAGGATTYTATAVLRLTDVGQDSQRTKQRAQTVER